MYGPMFSRCSSEFALLSAVVPSIRGKDGASVEGGGRLVHDEAQPSGAPRSSQPYEEELLNLGEEAVEYFSSNARTWYVNAATRFDDDAAPSREQQVSGHEAKVRRAHPFGVRRGSLLEAPRGQRAGRRWARW